MKYLEACGSIVKQTAPRLVFDTHPTIWEPLNYSTKVPHCSGLNSNKESKFIHTSPHRPFTDVGHKTWQTTAWNRSLDSVYRFLSHSQSKRTFLALKMWGHRKESEQTDHNQISLVYNLDVTCPFDHMTLFHHIVSHLSTSSNSITVCRFHHFFVCSFPYERSHAT